MRSLVADFEEMGCENVCSARMVFDKEDPYSERFLRTQ
jgi:hypothetical protein